MILKWTWGGMKSIEQDNFWISLVKNNNAKPYTHEYLIHLRFSTCPRVEVIINTRHDFEYCIVFRLDYTNFIYFKEKPWIKHVWIFFYISFKHRR